MSPTTIELICAYITLAVWLSVCPCCASYDSTKASSSFPGDDQAFAVGYDNTTDTILLFGGANNQRQLIQFRDDTFISTDSSFLSSAQSSYGYGQHYVQLNDQLFMTATDNLITVFHTRAPYESTMDPIQIPIDTLDRHSCLAIRDHYLFHVGGSKPGGKEWEAMDTAQIYNILNGEWLSGVPSLLTPRQNPGCVVIDHVLYVIGGRHLDNYIDSIVTFDVSDASLSSIAQQEWHYFTDTLSKKIVNIKLVRHRTDIIVVGGQSKSSTLTDVHVVDTIAGRCTLAGTLAVKTECPGVIVHEPSNTLYIFGGYPSSSFDTWQFIALPTMEPTSQPTTLPTIDPTNNPTSDPSFDPTVDPTNDPTLNPTCDPTEDQTFQPSFTPTKDPITFVPTQDPSDYPTFYYTVDITTATTHDSEETQETVGLSLNIGSLVLWVILTVIVIVCFVIIAVGLYIFIWLKKKREADAVNAIHIKTDNKDTVDTNTVKNAAVEKEVKLQEGNKESKDTNENTKVHKEVVTGEDSDTFSSDDLYNEMVHEVPYETKGFSEMKQHMQRFGGDDVQHDARSNVRVIVVEEDNA